MLKVENLNQYYGGSHTLRGLSFEVEPGKVTCLLGRNGVGKTTLVKCLMGLIGSESGRIGFDGGDITHAPTHERVRLGMGYVPQGREIFPRLTVEENLRMGLASRPAGTKIPARVFELFPVLKNMLGRRGGDLSGGQQQQLAIGRALAMEPRLLILDEPTEGIQPSIIKDIGHAIRAVARRSAESKTERSIEERRQTREAIRQIAETGGVAILLVEQYYDFARELADHYLLMERGEFIMRGEGGNMDGDGARQALAV
jgi:urea transport system ATP-binding protein